MVDEAPTEPAVEARSAAPAEEPVPADPPLAPTVDAPAKVAAPLPADPAPSKTRWWVAGAAHASFFGDTIDRSTLLFRFGFALSAGHRWGPWGAFLQVENDFWTETEIELEVLRGALNVGAGVDYLYWDDRVRASFAAGPSILMSDTAFDSQGHVGLFLDLRPTGLRFGNEGHWTLQIDPLTFTVEAPVLGSPSLVEIQYRTVLLLEYEL